MRTSDIIVPCCDVRPVYADSRAEGVLILRQRSFWRECLFLASGDGADLFT